jgi:hypothetical protein
MNEKLLQYIWQHRLFDQTALQTTDQQPVTVLHPGTWNQHQGPDFLHARVQINQTVWVGHVELHIRNSDWQLHAHASDPHYQNVILHVVWIVDRALELRFPVLSLQERVPKWLLQKYDRLMQASPFIPCHASIAQVPETVLEKWKERLIIERCTQKAAAFAASLHKTHQHWEQCFWQLLARCFGSPLNEALFESMAREIPVERLLRLKDNPMQVEALLFGQCGLLEASFADEYLQQLQMHYRFWQRKWNLKPVTHPVRLMRMRPAAFPYLRLSQLAATVQAYPQLWLLARDLEAVEDFNFLLSIRGNDYWETHYVPGKTIRPRPTNLSRLFVQSLLTNAFVPAIVAYAQNHQQDWMLEKALHWLACLPAEENRVCTGFKQQRVPLRSAYDSQALLQLKKQYCDARQCLRCMIGDYLLKENLKP